MIWVRRCEGDFTKSISYRAGVQRATDSSAVLEIFFFLVCSGIEKEEREGEGRVKSRKGKWKKPHIYGAVLSISRRNNIIGKYLSLQCDCGERVYCRSG